MNAVCLVVDRLHLGFLGCYGNAWVSTNELNRLAADGFVFDQALVDTADLDELYCSLWQGTHAAARAFEGRGPRRSLVDLLARANVASVLLTDDQGLAAHPRAEGFGESIHLALPPTHGSCDEIHETQLAAFFAAAAEWLTSARAPFCLWLHTRGLGAVWDAPLAMRNQFAEPDEPPPPKLVDVPSRVLAADFDPDELCGICQAYAGQISLLDSCLGGLLDLLDGGELAADTLFLLTAARGIPMGEHGAIGAQRIESPYSETVHVPLLWRFPDRLGQAGRSQALVQPADVHATLLDWFQCAEPNQGAQQVALTGAPTWGDGLSLLGIMRDEVDLVRDRSLVMAGNAIGLRTPAWYLLDRGGAAAEEGSTGRELYVKPDDRREVNDVADRCPETVALLEAALAETQAAVRAGTDLVPPLDESLVSTVR